MIEVQRMQISFAYFFSLISDAYLLEVEEANILWNTHNQAIQELFTVALY
jgi:hypothetical protein